MNKLTGRLYRPSNGTEGMCFTEQFCEQCVHEKFMHTQNHDDAKCDIFSRSLLHEINEPEYPKEWIYDDNDQPTCTSWKKWDWGDDDGNWINPDVPDPDAPNQLKLPLIMNDILEGHKLKQPVPDDSGETKPWTIKQ